MEMILELLETLDIMKFLFSRIIIAVFDGETTTQHLIERAYGPSTSLNFSILTFSTLI